MAFRPKHRTQLWRPKTGQFDCGPRTWQHGLDFARRDHDVPSIDRMRAWAGEPGPQTTNVYDADEVFERMGVKYHRKINAEWDVAVEALKRGAGIHLCVAYGVITDLQREKSGDKNFRGGHSIWVQEVSRTREGRRIVLSFDSLYDGRRAGIPKGPQWIRLSTLRAASAAFSGHASRFWGGIVPGGDTSGPGFPTDPDETEIPSDPDAVAEEGTPLPPREPDPEMDEGDDGDLPEVDEDEEVEVEA